MSERISIRLRCSKAYFKSVAKPNMSAYVNNLIEREYQKWIKAEKAAPTARRKKK